MALFESNGWIEEVDEGSGWPYWINVYTRHVIFIPPELAAEGSTDEGLAVKSSNYPTPDPPSKPPDNEMVMEAYQDNSRTRLEADNENNRKLIPVHESTPMASAETMLGKVQGSAARIVAGVAGGTAGFVVATGVTLFGGGPIAGVVAGTATAKTVEKFVEIGINWLRRNFTGLYHGTIRLWNGRAQLIMLQKQFRESCRVYRRENSHDGATRLCSSLKEDYCRRYPHWAEYFQ